MSECVSAVIVPCRSYLVEEGKRIESRRVAADSLGMRCPGMAAAGSPEHVAVRGMHSPETACSVAGTGSPLVHIDRHIGHTVLEALAVADH